MEFTDIGVGTVAASTATADLSSKGNGTGHLKRLMAGSSTYCPLRGGNRLPIFLEQWELVKCKSQRGMNPKVGLEYCECKVARIILTSDSTKTYRKEAEWLGILYKRQL